MIIKNTKFNNKGFYHYITDMIAVSFLVILYCSAILFMYEVSILAIITIVLGIIISIVVLIIITNKFKRKKKLSDIKTIEIKNNRIKIYFENETYIEYNYSDIKQTNICIEVNETHRPFRALCYTSIGNIAISFLFNDGNLWKLNVFYDIPKKSLNTIKYILKELKNYNINLKYEGNGDASKIQQEIYQ